MLGSYDSNNDSGILGQSDSNNDRGILGQSDLGKKYENNLTNLPRPEKLPGCKFKSLS